MTRDQDRADPRPPEGVPEDPTTDLRPGISDSKSPPQDGISRRSRGDEHSTLVAAGLRPEPSEKIGPYRIIDLLGRGGMGRVYLAEQSEPIRRRVALKVIARSLADQHAIYRFEAERKALARLSHPNIAQVFDAGETEDGHPYIVMEHVPGKRLTEYCDERKLSIDDRLELFVQVCRGLQHAHQKGLIHRDIKPSNILVCEIQDRAVPKIIDFGIAKALDEPLTDATQLTGDRIVGTPAYLSPESITAAESGLDLDTRSDVYSLGILLYELLLGTLPFDGSKGSFLQVVKRVTEQDAQPPSARLATLDGETRSSHAAARGMRATALGRSLHGDLDWITLKAMAKERSHRYVSAAALAEDIERHRNDLPVLAGPPSRLYRFAKFIRRNTISVLAGIVVALALITGFTARTLEARRANAEAARANQEAEAARQAELEAAEVALFLVDLFEVSNPGEATGNSITARELLDKGAKRVEQELSGQPLAQARLENTIGIIYRKLGLYGQSEPLLERALSLREEHLAPGQPEIASSLHDVVTLYWLQGRYSEAEPMAREVIELRREALGPDHPDLAESLDSLALILRRLGRLDEAEPLFLQALSIREAALGPNDPKVAESINGLAILYWNQGRLAEAAARFQRAISIWEHTYGQVHPELAASINNLAGVLRDQGRFDEAEPLYRRGLSIRLQVVGDDHPSIGYSASNLALLLRKDGQLERAEPLFRQALGIWEKSLGEDHPEVAFALNNLALLYTDMGRHQEGEELVRQALEINRKSLGTRHSSVAASLNIQALVYRGLDREGEAELLHREALEIYEEGRGPEHPSVAWSLHLLGELLVQEDRLYEAGPLLERALAIRSETLGEDHPDTLATRSLLDSLGPPAQANGGER